MRVEHLQGELALGSIGIAITSSTTGVVEVNDEICAILGYERAELLAKSWAELTHPDDLDADLTQFNRAIAGEIDSYAIDTRWLRKDGLVIDALISMKALRGADGAVDHFVALLRDVTERKPANDTRPNEPPRTHEKPRKESAERRRVERRLRDYEQCVEGVEEQIAVVDRDFHYVLANRAFLTYRGVNRDELIGRRAADVLDPSVYEPAIKPRLDECFRGKIVKYELKYVYPTLGERDLLITYFPIAGPAGIDRVAAVFQDVTDRKHAELERARLEDRLTTAQEDERRRIAGEVRDQLGQPITELNLKIAALRRRYADNPGLLEHLQDLELVACELDRDIDFLLWDIRPTTIDDVGLLVALSDHVRRWSQHFDIQVELLTSEPEGERPSAAIETVLYRAAREALTNIAKHASAEHVSIILERRPDAVSLTIEDDGCGFDAEEVFTHERRLGLRNIRERARSVGGTLTFESSPDRGTTMVIRIPVQPIHAGEEERG